MRRRQLAWIGAAALAAAGCGGITSLSDDVWFTLLAVPERAGDPVVAELRNNSDETVGHGICSTRIERRGTDGWDETGGWERFCLAVIERLPPGGRVVFVDTIPTHFEAGTYRLSTPIHIDDFSGRAHTPSFTLR